MADVYRETSSWPINDPASLSGDDLLLVDARLKVDALEIEHELLSFGADVAKIKPAIDRAYETSRPVVLFVGAMLPPSS